MSAQQRVVGTDEGATAVEYVVMASGIAAAVISAVFLLGTQVVALFDRGYEALVLHL